MKVINNYALQTKYDLNTIGLISHGNISIRGGQIEQLEDQVIHLTRVLANLIDHCNLTDTEILKITECDQLFSLDVTQK
jgi:hypothetical protein